MARAANIYRRFHLKEPNGFVKLHSKIPDVMAFLGYAIDIGYNSDKWNKNGKFEKYVHFFEHETKVLVFPRNHGMASGRIKIVPPKEVTYLGYAMDFHFDDEDRSFISRNEDKFSISDHETEEDRIKTDGSTLITFDSEPETSHDYVVSDPDGKMVFVICDGSGIIYAFINRHITITQHGIEG